MINAIAFEVPGEPQGKGRARASTVAGRARLYTPAKTVAYEGLIALAAAEAMRGAPLLTGPCALEVDALYAVPKSASKKARADMLAGRVRPTKKPDGDNVLKAVADALNGVVWADDVQAVAETVIKRYAEVPGLRVRVAMLEGQP